jgi:hypothetical protein
MSSGSGTGLVKNGLEEQEVIFMAKDQDIKKKEKKEHREKKLESEARCCYVADPCGCYVDTSGCYYDLCC